MAELVDGPAHGSGCCLVTREEESHELVDKGFGREGPGGDGRRENVYSADPFMAAMCVGIGGGLDEATTYCLNYV